MGQYDGLRLLIKDSISAAIIFAILYSRGYKQKYAMAAHLSTFGAARVLATATSSAFWAPTIALFLTSATILVDVWVASTLFCNPLQGTQCCARGETVPPFAFQLPLCSPSQESWYSIGGGWGAGERAAAMQPTDQLEIRSRIRRTRRRSHPCGRWLNPEPSTSIPFMSGDVAITTADDRKKPTK